MSEYFLVLEHQSLFIIPFQEVMRHLDYHWHDVIGKNPYSLETLDAFTRHFSDAKELFDFLKTLGIIPEDILEGNFLLIQVSKSLRMNKMKVRYAKMQHLFQLESLMLVLGNTFDLETSYIQYIIGWELKIPTLIKPKKELSREDFIRTCRKYVEFSDDEVSYLKLRRLAMIAHSVKDETQYGTPSRLTYQPHWTEEK